MPEEKKQVNVDFSNFPELLDELDKLVIEDGTDRSKFIRKLVRQEIARRQQLPLPEPKKNKKSTSPIGETNWDRIDAHVVGKPAAINAAHPLTLTAREGKRFLKKLDPALVQEAK